MSAAAGLIQPELLADGQVCVDMGEPILEGPKVPTTLAPTQVRTRGWGSCGTKKWGAAMRLFRRASLGGKENT